MRGLVHRDGAPKVTRITPAGDKRPFLVLFRSFLDLWLLCILVPT